MAAGSEALPLLGNDASYYLVAFLTKRPVKSPDMCEEDYDIPEVTFADTILWYTRFQSKLIEINYEPPHDKTKKK